MYSIHVNHVHLITTCKQIVQLSGHTLKPQSYKMGVSLCKSVKMGGGPTNGKIIIDSVRSNNVFSICSSGYASLQLFYGQY